LPPLSYFAFQSSPREEFVGKSGSALQFDELFRQVERYLPNPSR
jgi:hypothetical protein